MNREALLEAVVTAHRARSPRGDVIAEPAFADLDPDDRALAYREALLQRTLEAALDEGGLSSTAKAVLARLPR